MKTRTVLLLAMMLAVCADASAQTPVAAIDLNDYHTIGVSGGAKTNSRTVVSTDLAGVSLETGFIGSLEYGYWFDPQWQLHFTVGMFGAATNVDYQGTKTKFTGMILFGVSFYPLPLAMGKAGRPFVGISPGMYAQTSTKTSTLPPFTTETVSETVIGARFTGGVDVFPAHWLRITPSLSYHLIGDFSESWAGSYSGAEFSLGLGVVF
jgi:hypothetical protein